MHITPASLSLLTPRSARHRRRRINTPWDNPQPLWQWKKARGRDRGRDCIRRPLHMGVSIAMEVPQNGKFLMEIPLRMDDLGVTLFLGNLHMINRIDTIVLEDNYS